MSPSSKIPKGHHGTARRRQQQQQQQQQPSGLPPRRPAELPRSEPEQLHRHRRMHAAVLTLCVPLLAVLLYDTLPPPSLILWESIWLYKFFIMALTYRASPLMYAFNTGIQSLVVEKLIFGVSWRGLVKDFLARSAACFAAVYLCEARTIDTGVITLVQIYSLSFSWLATMSYVFVWQNFFQLTTAVSSFVTADDAADSAVAHGVSHAHVPHAHFVLLSRIVSTLQRIDGMYNPQVLLFLILISGIAATSMALRDCHGRALLFSFLYYSRCFFTPLHGISAPAWMILCVLFGHISSQL